MATSLATGAIEFGDLNLCLPVIKPCSFSLHYATGKVKVTSKSLQLCVTLCADPRSDTTSL